MYPLIYNTKHSINWTTYYTRDENDLEHSKSKVRALIGQLGHLPFARGCMPKNWASAVKLRQIQQISFPVSKTGKMHRSNVQMESGSWRKYINTQLSFWRKKAKDQVANFPGMPWSLFSSRLGSAEGKPSERRFKVHFVCFNRRERLFWNGNLSINIVLLTCQSDWCF